MKTVVSISGIRPDFIRMSYVFKELDKSFNHILIHTGQHYDKLLSDVFFSDLDIREPDFNLHIGGPDKKHYHQQAELGPKIIELFEREKISPDIVLFLGDSNSVLASVPLRKEGYKIGHIEAGMRSYDERMLEEINRKVCDHVSNILFVYHENYKQKAMAEGIPEERIHVVGNTIVEPLLSIADKIYNPEPKHILLDIHRPENFNYSKRIEALFKACKIYFASFNLPIKMLNFSRTLSAIDKVPDFIEVIPLMGYRDFIKFQQESAFIISDSGTSAEEPALLDIPVIVPRDFTERPESIENGNSVMLSLENDLEGSIQRSLLFLSSFFNSKRSCAWLGDGKTSVRICNILKKFL